MDIPSGLSFHEEEEALGKKHTLTLATHQTIELCQLMEKFKDVLQDTPGRTSLVQHAIPTKDALPVRLPPYRLVHTAIDTLNEEVKTLLEQEIIRPSNSPWAASIVLVAKKDGTRRMCIDYRRLNKVTVKDPYPLPNIEELISTLGASTFITTLDLSKGYYQVPVKPEDIPKTAFVTPKGKYEFLTMPFGLVSAPSIFQRLMDEVLDGIQEHTLAYLDDIIIHSKIWEDHLAHLEEVFSRLRKAGLTIKEKKCTFASGSCDYLGYVVGSGTVRPISAKVAAIRDYAAPQTKKGCKIIPRPLWVLSEVHRRFCNTGHPLV